MSSNLKWQAGACRFYFLWQLKVRLNCGCPTSKLKEGLERFKKSIDYLYNSKGL